MPDEYKENTYVQNSQATENQRLKKKEKKKEGKSIDQHCPI